MTCIADQILKPITFGDIEVEEVAIQDSLNDTSYDSNPVLEVLAVIAVNPVEDVQGTVRAQSKQIM